MGQNLRWASLAFLLWSMAYNLTAPLLPLYARELGAGPVAVGLVGSAGVLGALLLVFPLAYISDRFGQRVALILGWALSAAGVALLALATSWQGLLPGGFLAMAVGAALPTLVSLVLEEVEHSRWQPVFALLYGAAPVGLLVGSALGGVLADRFTLRFSVQVAAVACALSVVAIFPVRPDGRAPVDQRPLVTAPSRRRLHWIQIAFAALAGTGFFFVTLPTSFITPYLRDVGGQTLSATGFSSSLLAASQLGWSALVYFWPARSSRLKLGSLSLPTSTLSLVALVLIANGLFGLLLPVGLPLRIPGLWAIALVMRGAQYSLQSLGSSLMGEMVTEGAGRTMRLTLMNGAVGAGAAASPIVAGWLYAAQPAAPFLLSGVAALGGGLVLTLSIRYLSRWDDALEGGVG